MTELQPVVGRRGIFELMGDAMSYSMMSMLRRRAAKHGDFQRIVVPIDDLIGVRIAGTGCFELTQFDAVNMLFENSQQVLGVDINHDGVFVDVGANIGLYTLALAKHFRRTLAFEANPVTFKVLEANLALRDIDTANAINVGLSDSCGEATIFVPKNGNLGWATMNSQHHKIPVSEIKIVIKTLDVMLEERGVNEPVAMIKIDVEGHEPQVIRGARAVLERDGPVVFFEVLTAASGKICVDTLKESGYNHFYVFGRRLNGNGTGFSGYLDSIFRGIPVIFTEVDAADIGRNALVCAVRK